MESTRRSARCTPRSASQSHRHVSRTSGESPTDANSSERRTGASADSRTSGAWGDTSGMRARLTSSQFVGRIGELAELELALREAAASHPVLVLLGGDSGVGKTRLVTEFERRLAAAEGEGARVLRGESVEEGES